jgi:tRNA(Arg) A34 adenosine deaminase TadA
MEREGPERMMRHVIGVARKACLEDKTGGPFAAVVVRDGEIIGASGNRVIAENDPTWHGEVGAIRDACRKLGTHDLTGCVLYTAGYPCPMCYAAAWWARIGHIYYAAEMEDALTYGDFDDSRIYAQFPLPESERQLASEPLLRSEMVEVWQAFHAMPDRVHY